MKLLRKMTSFMNNEDGATAIEYGLIAAGISVVISSAVFSIGSNINDKFKTIKHRLR